MNKFGLRAIFEGDVELGKPIVFIPREFDDMLYFAMKDDDEFRYPFETIFMWDAWRIHSATGITDINGEMIYEKDIIETEIDSICQKSTVLYFTERAGFGIKSTNGSIISIADLPFVKILGIDF